MAIVAYIDTATISAEDTAANDKTDTGDNKKDKSRDKLAGKSRLLWTEFSTLISSHSIKCTKDLF